MAKYGAGITVQKICVFNPGFTQKCKKGKDGCCQREKTQKCEPFCFLETARIKGVDLGPLGEVEGPGVVPAELINGKKGFIMKDKNVIQKFSPNKACSSLGAFSVTATVKTFAADDGLSLLRLKEIDAYFKGAPDNLNITTCGFDLDVEVARVKKIAIDDSDAPPWWKDDIDVVDKVDVKTTSIWNCCKKDPRLSVQAVRFADGDWKYWGNIAGGNRR